MKNADELLYGLDLFGAVAKPKATGPVAERFLFAPFSVLDARAGEWQDRKRAWMLMGIEGEIGRECENGTGSHCLNNPNNISMSLQSETVQRMMSIAQGASPFDPVLCELAYRWWCPPTGQVVDPFAGGSVRGIVAGALGRPYWGCDLRQEQIDANEKQADEIEPQTRPTWVCGDAIEALATAPPADFVFSCPPYGDLEKYSDDPHDLSAMDWPTFKAAYGRIIMRCCAKLKKDRFACFVVGDFRDKSGHYRNFVSETIRAFLESGLELYNEAILVTSVGSASMRVTRQFNGGRKLCKTHQNVLVFVKGDWKRAAGNIYHDVGVE
jgi:DNA modification methylase